MLLSPSEQYNVLKKNVELTIDVTIFEVSLANWKHTKCLLRETKIPKEENIVHTVIFIYAIKIYVDGYQINA